MRVFDLHFFKVKQKIAVVFLTFISRVFILAAY